MKKCKEKEWVQLLNPLLQRQLFKYMCDRDMAEIRPFKGFIQSISEVYDSHDRDRAMTDRMFDISAEEYQEINNSLIVEKELIEKSIEVLLKAVEQFEPSAELIKDKDLYEIAEYLKDKAIHQKKIEQELFETREEAIRANNAKSDFLSTVSHEIRTPLNVIVGLIHILREEEYLPNQHESLDILNINAENLKYLINDILDFSKIESGKVELDQSEMNISELLQKIKKAHMSCAKDKNLSLKLFLDDELPEAVKGDSNRLGQCVSNLVANAIKYTERGEVQIQCSVQEKNDEDVLIHFSVSDTGIGVPENEIQKIFEPFQQASNRKSKEQTNNGTGLGLSIISQLVQIMGSEIEVTSELDKGSTFSFNLRFPLMESQQKTKLPEENKSVESQLTPDTKILLVEDFAFNVLVIKKILQKYGVQITVAENGQEAVDIIQEKPDYFDFILMDLRMPVLDGISATKEIRAMNITTPIIALTASTTVETMNTVRDIGMNGFISKPIEPKKFIEKIGSFVA